MQIYSVHAGLFKLDGGAMFGVVPKKIWNKLVPADDNNLCTWAMRCMVVVGGGHTVLIDCGMGDKQDEKFFGHYEPHGPYSLEASLKTHGITPGDITDVFLTHLHFDHCGGAVKKNAKGKLIPAFENARYWSNEKHWAWAMQPNAREKASFLKENFQPLQQHGVLHFIEENEELFPGFNTMWTYGHTEAMMLPLIDYKGSKLLYCADLLPSHAHIPLPYVMGYDVRPLVTIKEKEAIIKEAHDKKWWLFFEHDAEHACCNLITTEKGIRPDTFSTPEDIPVLVKKR